MADPLTATPKTVLIPDGKNAGETRVTWSAPNVRQLKIERAGHQPEHQSAALQEFRRSQDLLIGEALVSFAPVVGPIDADFRVMPWAES